MSGVTFRWISTPEQLSKQVGDYGKRMLKAIFTLAEVFAKKIEGYAKANAPWTDRTTNARQGLTGLAIPAATGVVIYLYHTMFYGIFLETANEGAYAIILKAMEAFYGPLMAAIRSLIGA
jgi:hypothetical protein